MLGVAQRVLGWAPAEFWAATVYELESALLVRVRESEPQPMTDAESMAFFDKLTDAGLAIHA